LPTPNTLFLPQTRVIVDILMSNESNIFQEGVTYQVLLGESFQSPEDEIYKTVSYDFKPGKLDRSQQGLLIETGNGKVQAKFANKHNPEEEVLFVGNNVYPQKETECVLIFDGSRFRLERVMASTALKYSDSKLDPNAAANRAATISSLMNSAVPRPTPMVTTTTPDSSKKRKHNLITQTEKIVTDKPTIPQTSTTISEQNITEEGLVSSDEELADDNNNDENEDDDDVTNDLQSFGNNLQNELLQQQRKMEEELAAAKMQEAANRKAAGQPVDETANSSEDESGSPSESSSGESGDSGNENGNQMVQ